MKWTGAAFACLLIALWGWAWIQTEHSDDLAERLVQQAETAEAVINLEVHVATFETSWGYKDEGGLCQVCEVSLTQQTGETVAEFATRCRETVVALKAEFPPDASCPQTLPQGQ